MRFLRQIRTRFRKKRFLGGAPLLTELCGRDFSTSVIATVAFNRPDMIECQIHMVRQHLAERDGYIVFDNSSKPDRRAAIREICRKESVPYVSLPKNPFKNSMSHGMVLNWIVRNFIADRRPSLFGFIDHDIFPMLPLSIASRLAGRTMYGLRRTDTYGPPDTAAGKWFLWAGYCFYDAAAVPVGSLDFTPSARFFLDTGGSNWPIIYSNAAPSSVRLAESTYQDFELIDGWLHIGNASGWAAHTGVDRRCNLIKALQESSPHLPEIDLERI
ncbi:hypothetical protein J2X13_001650 [Aminobacter aminovorans]|nr:hypothetical protein [Aminobacter aminovorans]